MDNRRSSPRACLSARAPSEVRASAARPNRRGSAAAGFANARRGSRGRTSWSWRCWTRARVLRWASLGSRALLHHASHCGSGAAGQGRQRHVSDKAKKDRPPYVAIRAKTPEAVLCLVRIERRHLPGELEGNEGESGEEDQVGAGDEPG